MPIAPSPNMHTTYTNLLYSVTPKPGRWDFVNIEKIHNKYQLLMVRFIKVIHPPRYGEI